MRKYIYDANGQPLSSVALDISQYTAITDLQTNDYFSIHDTSAPGVRKIATSDVVVALKTLIATDTLAAPTDVTTNNASTSAHGFLKKLSNVATEFMNGVGNWATPAAGPGTDLCLVYDTTAQGSANAATVINFAAELYDPGGLHSTSSNTSRITIATTGTYLVFALMMSRCQSSETMQLRFLINGSAISNTDIIEGPPNALTYSIIPFFLIVDLTAADYVEVDAKGTSANSINNSGTTGPKSYFGCIKLK